MTREIYNKLSFIQIIQVFGGERLPLGFSPLSGLPPPLLRGRPRNAPKNGSHRQSLRALDAGGLTPGRVKEL
jgi:hypothetical protein